MSAVSVKMIGAEALLRSMAKAPGILQAEVDRSLSRAAHEVARLAKRKSPKAFSHLANSIKQGKTFSLQHYVMAGMNYAYDVEHGTSAGRLPSRQHIIEWMRVKRIKPAHGSIKSSAFLIARSIKANGTEAQPFMHPALKEKRARIVELVRQGENRALKRIAHV